LGLRMSGTGTREAVQGPLRERVTIVAPETTAG
jgi:hypothetical protein